MPKMLITAQEKISALDKTIKAVEADISNFKEKLKSSEAHLVELKRELSEWQEVRTIFHAKDATASTRPAGEL